ncbi:hypothetical protein CALVIDRAFT_345352 [Calocera viscosa TUFC12733]|uniref:Uncharacterized protein n=1 Tax=Calocera viscosa (strain TUFC12733) TaxID=1330018 RepID=A0A167HAP4_CALVF|nr:hypothetical protein CALVIDRAFT_345352 [Calocera viscosa TUFC12733]
MSRCSVVRPLRPLALGQPRQRTHFARMTCLLPLRPGRAPERPRARRSAAYRNYVPARWQPIQHLRLIRLSRYKLRHLLCASAHSPSLPTMLFRRSSAVIGTHAPSVLNIDLVSVREAGNTTQRQDHLRRR